MYNFENRIEQNSRDSFIDFLRGVAIVLVLWGHSIQYLSRNLDFYENPLFKIIYSFHMPLFMFLSGYVFYWSCKNKSMKKIIFSRLKGLGVPILTWGLLSCAISVMKNPPESVIFLVRMYIDECLRIWFLWAVLLSSIIVAVIYKIISSKSILLSYSVMIMAMIVVVYLPSSSKNLFMYPYFVLGFAFCEYNLFADERGKLFKRLSVLIWIVMLFFYEKKDYIYTSGISLRDSEYGFKGQVVIDVYRYAIGLFGVVAVVYILGFVYSRIKNTIVERALDYTGRHSLDIYVMQRILLEILIAYIVKKIECDRLSINLIVYDFVITLLCGLSCCVILGYISRMIEKNKILSFVLFGRTNVQNYK